MAGEAPVNNEQRERNANAVLNHARQYVESGSYGKGYDLFFDAFEKFPGIKAGTEIEFREVLSKLNAVLCKMNKFDDIFLNFERATEAYPDNKNILNDIGKYLNKFGYYTEACCHFQKALNCDSGYVDAEKNLNSIKNFLMERWHYRMLNDKIRNNAYRDAIHKEINPLNDSVLDVGTGTGLLTMYAFECKPTAITAVDGSQLMADMAQKVFDENEIKDVTLISKMSTSLDCNDVGGKRSLIITELFDAGLFGEHVLQTLHHAWEFLTSNNGRIMPCAAEFFIAGVKSDFLNLRYQLSSDAKAQLNIPKLIVHIGTTDTYDCEDVHMIKDVTYMTKPQSLLSVNFNSIEEITKKLDSMDPYDVSLEAKEDGEVNSIIGWFDLCLSEGIKLTTNPMDEKRANAWQQAIFFEFLPKAVKKDDTISLHFSTFGGKLAMLPDSTTNVIKISPDMLRFLNDKKYMSYIKGCMGSVSIYLGQLAEMSEINVVDLCPFPFFGLLLMKRGAESLLCYAKTREDKRFIKKVFKMNKISMSKVEILVGAQMVEKAFTINFHVIFNNIIEWCGDLSSEFKTIGDYLHENHLIQGGLYLPAKVELYGQIISCDWLNVVNRVYDENVHDYKIAKYMNHFQVSQNIHVDLVNLDFKPISDAVFLGSVGIGMGADGSEVINVPIINDGDANAIICWWTIQIMEHEAVITTKRGNSFADGIAFLANPAVTMKSDGIGNILKCVASDGAFKLLLDLER